MAMQELIKVEEESKDFVATMKKIVDKDNSIILTATDGSKRNARGRQLIQRLKDILENVKLNSMLENLPEDTIQQHEKLVQKLLQEIRSMSVAYKRRMDQQRAQDREKLLSSSSTIDKAALRQRARTSNSTIVSETRDVTSSLRRTRQIMSAQVERAETASVLLDDGQQTLRKTASEYDHLDGEINTSKKLLTDLERQARADKLWIVAGFVVLGAVILYILYQRIGFRFF